MDDRKIYLVNRFSERYNKHKYDPSIIITNVLLDLGYSDGRDHILLPPGFYNEDYKNPDRNTLSRFFSSLSLVELDGLYKSRHWGFSKKTLFNSLS